VSQIGPGKAAVAERSRGLGQAQGLGESAGTAGCGDGVAVRTGEVMRACELRVRVHQFLASWLLL
jgi:hypothetical protein